MIVTLIVVSMIIFVMARVGGDPRTLLLDDHATKEQWESLGRELGMDKPYYPPVCDLYLGCASRGLRRIHQTQRARL